MSLYFQELIQLALRADDRAGDQAVDLAALDTSLWSPSVSIRWSKRNARWPCEPWHCWSVRLNALFADFPARLLFDPFFVQFMQQHKPSPVVRTDAVFLRSCRYDHRPDLPNPEDVPVANSWWLMPHQFRPRLGFYCQHFQVVSFHHKNDLTRWKVLYYCACRDPRSLQCLALAHVFTQYWRDCIVRYVRAWDFLPPDLPRASARRAWYTVMSHCGFCELYRVVELLGLFVTQKVGPVMAPRKSGVRHCRCRLVRCVEAALELLELPLALLEEAVMRIHLGPTPFCPHLILFPLSSLRR